MRDLLLVSLLIVLLLPILHGAAQPDNMTQGPSPGDVDRKRINEEISTAELKEIWEEIKDAPTPELIPEPYIVKEGKIITPLGTNERDYYFDTNGSSFYVYVGDKLVFANVADSWFKGTYFSIFDRNNTCLNCYEGDQTYGFYKDYQSIKSQVDNNPAYRDKYVKIHIKYFIQAILTGSVYKNGNPNNKVQLKVRDGTEIITRFEAELWSEANYCKEKNDKVKCNWVGWQLYGYPHLPLGGAEYIKGKRLSVSVGLSYYTPYPYLSMRPPFGHPHIIKLYSRFYHQFAIISAS